ncbi:MAG: HEAT repeat domain-containing protein [Candidatus Dormibacteria bacterium]
MSSFSRETPAASVAAECRRRGTRAVVSGCIDILERGEFDDALAMALSTGAARQVLAGREGGRGGYWPRVWAIRALLYAWEDDALPVLLSAASDDSWRVREMVAKVLTKRHLEEGFSTLLRLQEDPVPRVRAAAERAIRTIATQNG